MCFRAIKPQNKNLKNCGEKINYFPQEGGGAGGYPSMENSMEIINIFFQPFPNPNTHFVRKNSSTHLRIGLNGLSQSLKHAKSS